MVLNAQKRNYPKKTASLPCQKRKATLDCATAQVANFLKRMAMTCQQKQPQTCKFWWLFNSHIVTLLLESLSPPSIHSQIILLNMHQPLSSPPVTRFPSEKVCELYNINIYIFWHVFSTFSHLFSALALTALTPSSWHLSQVVLVVLGEGWSAWVPSAKVCLLPDISICVFWHSFLGLLWPSHCFMALWALLLWLAVEPWRLW